MFAGHGFATDQVFEICSYETGQFVSIRNYYPLVVYYGMMFIIMMMFKLVYISVLSNRCM